MLPVVRDLPWRATRDPWSILVAEACAQQTQAGRAAVAWAALCERFPRPVACAAADRAEVLRAWQGLGYYRRAVALHDASIAIVERHGGAVPDDLATLMALPGVGPYTARAVLAFAFERDVGVVDTNVARILARAVAGAPLTATAAQRLADAAVPPGLGWAHNQAMLDLGQAHCAARPRCEGCPLATVCVWRRAGCPSPDPARTTAGAARPQRAFAGSDREGRGRLLAAVLAGAVRDDDCAAVMGWPDDPARAHRVAAAMARDGVVRRAGAWWRAPSGSSSPTGRVAAVPGRPPRAAAAP